MGHVEDVVDPFTGAAAGGAERVPVRFGADQIAWLCAAGLLNPDIRFELINGEIVEMAPDRAPHTTAKSILARWLGRRLGDDVHVGAEVTFKLSDTTLIVPDVAIWRPDATTGFLSVESLTLAVEIVASEGRVAYEKTSLYNRAAVPELWIIDLSRRTTRVCRAPDKGRYTDIVELGFEDPIATPVDGGATVVLSKLVDVETGGNLPSGP